MTKMYPGMEESKDLSKNLISGDFERQCRNVAVEKCPIKKVTFIAALGSVVGALVLWLLVLTVVREVQIRELRREVDQLSANMIMMNVNIKSLNQMHSSGNKFLNEMKPFEDAFYADEDIGNTAESSNETGNDLSNESLEKLHVITVLENDSIGDDEDMDIDDDDDDDDGESGDFYSEYDKRREKIGTTNMVHLQPEDFTDTVVNYGKYLDEDLVRTINENPENPNLKDFLPKSPPKKSPESVREKRSVFPDSPADAIDPFISPRTIAKDDTRKKTKKFSSHMDSLSAVDHHKVTRTVRNSDNEITRRPFIAAHFHGNTSHLSTEIHEHYKGNGLVRVSHDAAHDVWYPSPWTIASPHPRPTLTRNGHIHVHHTGVYLVYVQIYYLDSHDIISWVLHRTNADIEGRETLLQCAQSSHSTEPIDKPNSCFSAAALFLKAGDRLAVRNTGGDRHSLMQQEKSFIGLIKLADAEDPTEEF